MDEQFNASSINTQSDSDAHASNAFESHSLDDFEVLRELGKGGFGVVLEVKNKINNQKYAVKRIKLPNDEKKRKQSFREPKALAICKHENIVKYHFGWIESSTIQQTEDSDAEESETDDSDTAVSDRNYGGTDESESSDSCFTFEADSQEVLQQTPNEEVNSEDDDNKSLKPIQRDNLYIQMELCRGSLEKWRSGIDCNYLFIFDRYQIFYELVAGVSYLHSKQLIHRDLKPSNILIGLDSTIKIGDFGSVTTLYNDDSGDETASYGKCILRSKHVGTALYMAPEQKTSRVYDHNVDIYALGVILFELLANFATGMERCETIQSLRAGKFPDDFQLALPVEYEVIKRMLSINPTKRPELREISFWIEHCYLEAMRRHPRRMGYTHFPKSFFKIIMAIRTQIKIQRTIFNQS